MSAGYLLLGNEFYVFNNSQLNIQLLNWLLNSLMHEWIKFTNELSFISSEGTNFTSDFCLSSVFCCILYSTNLLVSSLPEVGSGRTIWRSPSAVELSRSLLLLCFGGSLSWISAFNQLNLHCAYQDSSNRSSIVACVT
jgi:hypothetical protein